MSLSSFLKNAEISGFASLLRSAASRAFGALSMSDARSLTAVSGQTFATALSSRLYTQHAGELQKNNGTGGATSITYNQRFGFGLVNNCLVDDLSTTNAYFTHNLGYWLRFNGKGIYIDIDEVGGGGGGSAHQPMGLVTRKTTPRAAPPMCFVTNRSEDAGAGVLTPDNNSDLLWVYDRQQLGTAITVSSVVLTSWPVVTVNTATNHNFFPGNLIRANMTGWVQEIAAVISTPSATQFTFRHQAGLAPVPTFTAGSVQLLRGALMSINDDGAVVLCPRAQTRTDSYDNGRGQGALITADGATLNLGAGWGVHLRGPGNQWRRLGDGGRAITATAGAAIITAASNTIQGTDTVMLDAAAAVTVGTATTTPILPDSYDGHCIRLINVGATNAITLTDQGTMAASNLRLTAATVVLGPRDSIELTFSTTLGDWVQTGNLVNVL